MNKSLLLLGLASVMSAFTGCATDEAENAGVPEQQQSSAPQTLVAQLQDDASTRVAMAPNGRTVQWSANDAIAVYSADNTTKKIRYKLKSGFENQSVGEFELVSGQTGNITLASYGTYDGLEEKTYVAIYPSTQLYASQMSPFAPLGVGATIPNVQQYTKGSFDPKALPMMAVFQNSAEGNPAGFTALKFKYMGSLIRVPVASSVEATLQSVKVTGEEEAKLAGTIFYQFYSSMFYDDKAGRDACYSDMTQPMNFTAEGRYTSLKKEVLLKGPIAVSSTPTDVIFGVLPFNYEGTTTSGSVIAGKLTFTFKYDDGSAIEKTTQNGPHMQPGDVAVLPTFTLNAPYMPVATIQNGVLSWVSNEAAESYQVVVLNGDEPLTTINVAAADAAGINIAEKIWPKLESLVGTSFQAGDEMVFDLQIKAKYNAANAQYADYVYSAPVEAPTYTAPIPKIECSYVVEKYDYIKIENYNAYPKVEWARVVISHEKPATEADFANAKFTKVTNQFIQPLYYDGEPYGLFAYMIRALAADDTTVLDVAYLYHQNAEPEPPAQKLSVAIDPDAGSIIITNYMDLAETCKPTATYVIYKEYDGTTPWTQVSDFDDVKGTNTYKFNSQGTLWFSDMNFPGADSYGNNDKYYSVLIVMESDQLPNGSITLIQNFYNHYSGN